MSYQVLARKWRPRNFAEMVGQEHVVRALGNALDNDRLHHAYLFTGTRGVGKTTLARILSKSLNCETGVTSSPCGKCSVCREIDEGRFVDLLEVDAASKTGVDDTRELLDNVPYAPVRGRYKVYLIDEVHMFSGHSFNALLKTLEEPPPHVKFLLATTDPQKVPVTVLSRCLQFNLKRLPVEQIEGQLRHILEAEGVAYEPPALGVLARAADGSMRDGLSLLDQAIGFGGGQVKADEVRAMLGVVAGERLPDMLAAVAAGDAAAVMASIGELAEHAPDFGGLLREVVTLLHRVAILQQVPEAAQASWGEPGRLQSLASSLPAEDVQLYYQIALTGQRDLPLAPDMRSGFEMVMLRMLAFRPDGDGGQVSGTPGKAAVTAPAGSEKTDAPAATASPKRGDANRPPETERVPAAQVALPDSDQTASSEPIDVARLQDWHAFVDRMGLKGMAAQLADNSTFQDWDGKQLSLRVDPACAGLLGSLAERRLQESLSTVLGCAVTLNLAVAEGRDETPAQRQKRESDERQRATEADIADDPLVQAVQEKFDATIVPDSIRRIEHANRGG
ncbi:MAG: DNA polymerase III subunit gamma/tau [Gammaproteobacteria bacterium]|nr:DNA polymerase III subunit gamma/tau [Gammaproteobacteria bacterium]